MEQFEQFMEINTTQGTINNPSNTFLNSAAELFIYLNTCSNDLKPWFNFYKDLFSQQPPGFILLTLNRMLKNTTSSQNKDLRAIVIKLLHKTTIFFSQKNMTGGIERFDSEILTNFAGI